MTIEELKQERARIDRLIKEKEGYEKTYGCVKIRKSDSIKPQWTEWLMSIKYIDEVCGTSRWHCVKRALRKETLAVYIDDIIKDLFSLKEDLENEN